MAPICLCNNNFKNMVVKIVHPGGRIELHDRPVLASEILIRNPRCCVAQPNVFQQPWAVVSPETTLMPGQKFYVVPVSTIRKLQRLSFRYSSPSLIREIQAIKSHINGGDEEEGKKNSTCCLFVNKINSSTGSMPYSSCFKQSDGKERDGHYSSDYSCFACLFTVLKIKARLTGSSNELGSLGDSSETVGLTGKGTENGRRKGGGGSPKRLSSFDNWQPSLASISEE